MSVRVRRGKCTNSINFGNKEIRRSEDRVKINRGTGEAGNWKGNLNSQRELSLLSKTSYIE